jgi:hypothetical protein
MAVLTAFLCCGATAPQGCQPSGHIGPSGAEVAGVGIAAGAAIAVVVLIEVHHVHHTMKGCVFAGPNGLELQTQGDGKTYALAGDTAKIRAGDLVRFHGSKVKKAKDSTGDQTFSVEKISRDYGPCKSGPRPPANSTNP